MSCFIDICFTFPLFIIFSLTEREKREREHKKTILQLAKEHEKARELENVQRYHMPRDLGKGEKGKIKSFDYVGHSSMYKAYIIYQVLSPNFGMCK